MIRWAAFGLLLVVAMPAAAGSRLAWADEVAEASHRFGLPQAWIRRVIEIESGGRLTWRGRPVRSSAGAMGLMQLMPGTWRAMRAAHGLGADPDDPGENILAGTAYLRAMYDRFGYPGLFAAYNAGPARYADHLARGTRLPAETVNYLARATSDDPLWRKFPDPSGTQRRHTAPLFVATPGNTGENELNGMAERPGLFFPLHNHPPG